VTEKELAGILAAILAPIIGRYLAAVAAQRLYDQLKHIDQQALDDLLIRYSEEAP
jgi:hypothetical protein